MSDETKESEGEGAPDATEAAWRDSGEQVELIIDDGKPVEEEVPEEYKGLSKVQIIEKLKSVEASKAAEPAPRSDIDRLSESLSQMMSRQAPSASAPQPEPETWDKTKERLNEQFVSDPAEAAAKLFTEKMGPMVAQSLMAVTDMARTMLERDPEKGSTFKKFATEIDAEVAKQPPNVRINPKIYELAYNQVISRHVDEIIKEKVAEAVAAATKTSPAASPQPAQHQEGRPGVARPSPKVQVRMKDTEATRLRSIGVDPQDFADAMGGEK